MTVLDKLRDPGLGKRLAGKVGELASRAAERLGRPAVLMEVCGTHTAAISRSGLRGLLVGRLELRSGPGCPVCVTNSADIDKMVALSRIPNVMVATFGDMVRVPGVNSSLEQERARGARVKVVYSPADAVNLAEANPDKEVIFLGVGFETTAPLVALSIAEAVQRGLKNYSVLPAHKLVPPVLAALLSGGEVGVDGLILPGHVSAVTGRAAFDFIGRDFGIPAVIAGFEPLDILGSVYRLLEQTLSGRAQTVNDYGRVVREEGNTGARRVMERFFDPGGAIWRGFGFIPGSGLSIKKDYASYDAGNRFPVRLPSSPRKDGCLCGDLLKGKIYPDGCPLFAVACTPFQPVGPCMVSSEGACAVYYHYEKSACKQIPNERTTLYNAEGIPR